MTERKVLIVRVKGGMQIAQGVTNHIIEGLVRGVLVLPEEVTSYAVEEFPALGVENEDTIYTVEPEGVPAIKILNKDDILPIGTFVQVQEESEQIDDGEAPQPPHRSRPNPPRRLSQRARWRRSSGRFLYGCKPTSKERSLAGHRECPTLPAAR